MKKIIYLFAFAALFVACEKEEMSTPPLSVEDPLAEVIRIAQEGAAMLDDAQTRSVVARRIDRSSISCKINPATRAGEADDTLYYVVNYADNAGFAIVSANENASDGARLIAVTESGSYTAGEKTENEGFNMYVNAMEAYYAALPDTIPIIDPPARDEVDPGVVYESEEYSAWSSVAELLSVKWGQDSPYNTEAPYRPNINPYTGEILYYSQSYAGCGPIAIAQILTYHNYPETINLTYDNHTNTIISLDWNAIKMHSQTQTCTGCNAETTIAQLVRQIGELANASYYTNITTVTQTGILNALSCLGYEHTECLTYSWGAVVDEFNNARPVFIGARDSNGSGHVWVLDGYKTRECIRYEIDLIANTKVEIDRYDCNYVHCNWGYNGSYDGYYQDGIFDSQQFYQLDDSSDSTDSSWSYTIEPFIITNIKPLAL